jgi:hypothetical protein
MVTGVTALAGVAQGMSRRRREGQLRSLALQWRMNYSPRDQWRLTGKVARNFPVPGAAHIKLTDLIYLSGPQAYRYIFTAEYTVGVVLGKRRLMRVGSFEEPRDRETSGAAARVTLGAAELSILEQYRSLSNTRPMD